MTSAARRWSALTALLSFGACAAADAPAVGNGVGSGGASVAAPAGTAGVTVTTGSGGAAPLGTTNTGASGATSTGAAGRTGIAGSAAAATAGKSGSAGASGAMATAGAGGMAATAGTGGSGTGSTPQKSAGCGMAPPGSDTSVMVGGATGPYILDMPTNYDNTHAYPIVFVWHGAGVTNTAFHDYLNMHMVVGNDAIVVTPECTDGSSWPQDASYFDALLEHFSSKYCIDTSRVFSTGHSMGGMHTALLACLRADKLRGDAVLAAPHSAGNCVKGNMGVMMSVGMSDFVASYTTEFAYWTQYGGCDMNMKMAVDPMSFTSGAPEESGHCDEYGGCAAGTPVRTCTFDGGHEIPGWVAGAVWSFFKKLL